MQDGASSSDTPSWDGYVSELADKQFAPRQFAASYRYSENLAELTPRSVPDALGIQHLSSEAALALEAIEHKNDPLWVDFKWKLTALVDLQDGFDCPLFPAADPIQALFHKYYFYFEGCRLLAESVLCGLNAFYGAAHALLRPIIEFHLLQVYYYRLTDESRSYEALESYLRTHRAPNWHRLVKGGLPADSFASPIRLRVQHTLRALSKSGAHPYHPDDSPFQHTSMSGEASLVGLLFWYETRVVIETVLWLYYANFPMLFCPVDVLRKFGCNGPVGVVVDQAVGECVKRSMKARDYEAFRDYAMSQETAQSLLRWVISRPDLSDAEIHLTWNEQQGEWPGLIPAYVQTMARLRVMRLAMALPPEQKPDADVEQLVEMISSLEWWRELNRLGPGSR